MKSEVARTNLRATPSDIVVAMLDGDTITLRGFDVEQMPAPWFRPGVRYVSASIAPDDLVREVVGATRARKWLERGAWILTLVAVLSVWAATSALSGGPVPSHGLSAAWRVTHVESSALHVSSGQNTYLVPLGSRLPNGERLLATSPDRRAYTTDAGTTILQPQVRRP
jgi:hypothetical protein